ncbi:MAG TPA: flippase [Ktedonobacterales bacterium]
MAEESLERAGGDAASHPARALDPSDAVAPPDRLDPAALDPAALALSEREALAVAGNPGDGAALAAGLEPAATSVLEGAAGRVLSNAAIQIAEKVVSYGCALATLALTTRLLGAGPYGDYTIAVVFLSFFVLIADSGITTAGVREAARFPDRLQRIVDAAFSLKLGLGLLTYVAAVVIVSFLPYAPQVKLATYGLAASWFLLSLGVTWDIVFQSRLRMEILALADLALKVCVALGIVALFWRAQVQTIDPNTLFFLVVLVTALGNLAALLVRFVAARRMVRPRLRLDGAYARMLLKISIPLGIFSVLGQIHYKADTILLSLLVPASDVAVYGVAYRVIDLLLVFFAVLVSVVFPVLARYAYQGGERYTRAVTRVMDAALSLICPLALGTALLAPGIVAILGGPAFASAALPLSILAGSIIFSLLNVFYTYLIIAKNGQSQLIWVVCINIVANLALNYYAIPRYSYVGAAVATDLTEGLGLVLAVVLANRMHRSLPSLGGLGKTLLACAAMAAAIVGAQRLDLFGALIPSTLALVGLGALVYGAVLFAVGGVDPRVMEEVARRVPMLRGHVNRLAARRGGQ